MQSPVVFNCDERRVCAKRGERIGTKTVGELTTNERESEKQKKKKCNSGGFIPLPWRPRSRPPPGAFRRFRRRFRSARAYARGWRGCQRRARGTVAREQGDGMREREFSVVVGDDDDEQNCFFSFLVARWPKLRLRASLREGTKRRTYPYACKDDKEQATRTRESEGEVRQKEKKKVSSSSSKSSPRRRRRRVFPRALQQKRREEVESPGVLF